MVLSIFKRSRAPSAGLGNARTAHPDDQLNMDLSQDEVELLVSEVKDYQITHGSLLKLVKFEEASTVPARPVGASLTATPFPRKQFDEAFSLQTIFNELYIKAASDPEWLYSALGPLLQSDAFFASLWDVYTQVEKAGIVQPVTCGIFRSDYMSHVEPDYQGIKQVEMNTFSIAGPAHAERVVKMHGHLRRIGAPGAAKATEDVPVATNVKAIVETLTHVHSMRRRDISKPSCVLMIVQPRNFNVADERPIEYGLWDNDIPCFRCEWRAVLDCTTLTEDRRLHFKPPHRIGDSMEVSVIYYRAGYEDVEYDERGKETRLRLELSTAIKCPDILTHLTTFKAVQHALASPDALQRFLPAQQAARLQKTFMSMHTLDEESADGREARRWALDPEMTKSYVLKPNLEGGGHNVFGEDIPEYLRSIPESEWSRFTLMKMIEPPETMGLLMMPADIYQGPVVSELGILGTCICQREGKEVTLIENRAAGFTFKTKPAEELEMSVVKGYGCFDCPRLSD